MARRSRSAETPDDQPTDVPACAPTIVPALAKLHARSEIGLPDPRHPAARLPRSLGVVVHCTGGHRPASTSEVVPRLRRIAAVHMGAPRVVDGKNLGGRGWAQEGYHWAVDPWGHVWQLRGWGVVGAHAKTGGFNLKSHGIVVLGHGTEITEAEWAAVLWLIDDHDRRFGRGFVVGHREIPGVAKACPGPAVLERVQALGRGL